MINHKIRYVMSDFVADFDLLKVYVAILTKIKNFVICKTFATKTFVIISLQDENEI